MVDPSRRTILKTGAAATVVTRVFAEQTGQDGAAMSFYEKGPVRIRYEEVGSGFPLLIIAGGGLNSTIAGLATHPFDPMEEFKGEYRCIAPAQRQPRPIFRSARDRSAMGWVRLFCVECYLSHS